MTQHNIFTKWIRRFLKLLLWTFTTLIFLFLIIVFLIRLDSVQNFLIQKATHFISDKTKTNVRIGHVGISFPKEVVLENVFLDDLHKDTLLSAGLIGVDVDMFGLFSDKLIIDNIRLENIIADIHNTEIDSAFNYEFILNAFSSEKNSSMVDTAKGEPMEMSVNEITLTNINFRYGDIFHKSNIVTKLGKLNIEFDEVNISQNKFHLNSLELSDATMLMEENKPDAIENNNSDTIQNILPDIQFSELNINNVVFASVNHSTNEKMEFNVGKCNIKAKSISLSQSKIEIDDLLLENSSGLIQLTNSNNEPASDDSTTPWIITANEIVLNAVAYKMDFLKTPVARGFDANHMDAKDINTVINDFVFDPDHITAEIESMSLKEKSGIEVKELSTKFLFNDKQIALNDLDLQTKGSRIKNRIVLKYDSRKSLSVVEKLGLDINLNNSEIDRNEIAIFQPGLFNKPSLSGIPEIIFLDTRLDGKVGDINIKEMNLSFDSTLLKLTGRVKGLPDFNKSFFDIDLVQLKTNRSDILKLIAKQNTYIPDYIAVNGKVRGTIKNFNGDADIITSSGNIFAKINMEQGSENFSANIKTEHVDLSHILRDTSFGKLNMTADINGTSFDPEKGVYDIDIKTDSFEYKKYMYSTLKINGKYGHEQFEGVAAMNDTNLAFTFDGKINVAKDNQQFDFRFNLAAADLQKLNLIDQDIKLSAKTSASIRGADMSSINGNARIDDLFIMKENKTYRIDSVLFATFNEKGNSSLNLSSAIVDLDFKGTFNAQNLGAVIKHQFSHYLDIADSAIAVSNNDFTFSVNIKNHPVISEVIMPDLETFDHIKISGSLDSKNNILVLNADVPKLNYGGIDVNNLLFSLSSDADKLDYNLSVDGISNSSFRVIKTTLSGQVKDNVASINLLMKDTMENEKLNMKAELTSMYEGDYHFKILPGLTIAGTSWNLPKDNFIRFGTHGMLFNHFELSNEDQYASINTPTQKAGEEISFDFRKFRLETFSRLIEKDSSFLEGKMDGKLQTKYTETGAAFTAALTISDLSVRNNQIGNIKIDAVNNAADNFKFALHISGNENDVDLNATYKTTVPPDLNIQSKINSMSMQTVAALSNGKLTNAKGSLNGEVNISGNPSDPKIKGQLQFKNAGFQSTFANNYFVLDDEKFEFDDKGIYLNSFTISDTSGNTAKLNGSVYLDNLSIKSFDLGMVLNNFTVLNTVDQKDKLFFGKLTLNSNNTIKGTPALPKIFSKTTLVGGSSLTVIVPEASVSTDRGEGVVVFTDPQHKIHPVFTVEEKEELKKSEIKGFDVAADIELDKKSTLKIVIDPISGDSLVLRGDGTLSFGIDPGGATSLTGTFTVFEGSYRVSLQDFIHKDFSIKKGSTITWNGDPLDAEISIDAVHEQKASPAELVAGQIGNLSEQEKNMYKQVLPFQVILHMKGNLLKPDISFEIDLPSKDRMSMGGTVYSRLNQLNNDPSELNKQVFALLVLGRFVQQDPLAGTSGSSGIGSVARTSVSKFISQQLNQFSGKHIKGVEVNFDLLTYDDYSTGSAEATTQIAIEVKKSLFNDKVSVQVGSTVGLSENNNNSNTNEFASDVEIEYKLGESGVYRLKAFHQNEYDDGIEGPVDVTGVGLIYNRDFDLWKDLFKTKKEEEVAVPLKKD